MRDVLKIKQLTDHCNSDVERIGHLLYHREDEYSLNSEETDELIDLLLKIVDEDTGLYKEGYDEGFQDGVLEAY